MKAFLYILKTVLYGWVGAAKEFSAILCKLYRRWRSRKGKGRVVATSHCVPIYNPAFVKPDPLIYLSTTSTTLRASASRSPGTILTSSSTSTEHRSPRLCLHGEQQPTKSSRRFGITQPTALPSRCPSVLHSGTHLHCRHRVAEAAADSMAGSPNSRRVRACRYRVAGKQTYRVR